MATEVLLVEDNLGDVRLMRESCADQTPTIHLHVAADGVEALAFLKQEGVYHAAPRPDLILLDLNLPRIDGRQVLEFIKGNDSLKVIPTIILTMSEAETDVIRSYQLHANCYLKKPLQLDEFENLMRRIFHFWVTEVKLPKERASDE
jgi:CheY-like chemotaxis protein